MELMAAKANRVGRLSGYGNAIDPVLAAVFIRASRSAIEDTALLDATAIAPVQADIFAEIHGEP